MEASGGEKVHENWTEADWNNYYMKGDLDGDGALNYDEFRRGSLALNPDMPEEDIESIF